MNETASYSNPDSPVRHSYPLAVTDTGFFAAAGLCLKTTPLILVRLGALAAFALSALLWLALCGGVAWLFSGRNHEGGGGVILFLLGVGLPAGIYWWLRKYVLYMLKLGHIAVLTKLITDGKLPDGASQVQLGKEAVLQNFKETQILFAVDSLVEGIISAFNRTLDWLTDKLPIPNQETVMGIVHRVINAATTYIDETIFSYNLARGDENVWRSSADGLVYYAQNAKPVLKTAIVCVVLEYVLTFGCFVVMLIPCWLISHLLPDAVGSFAWALGILLAAGIRDALLRPIFLTMVALTFHQSTHGQEIDTLYTSVLAEASEQFQELTQKAAEFSSPNTAETVAEQP